MIFHWKLYNENIKKITNVLNVIKNGSIQNNKNKKKGRILKLKDLKFLLAKIHQILNQYLLDKKYENTFNDNKSKKFIIQMIDYFNIKDKKKLTI